MAPISKKTYIIAAAAGLIVIGVAAAVIVLDGNGEQASVSGPESTTTAEATWTVANTEPALATESAGASQAEPPAQPKPSYVRYAHVSAINGVPDSASATLDWFEILLDAEATQYAEAHGQTPPSNGILYVNEQDESESLPIGGTVTIVYSSGGVESLEQHQVTLDQLQAWAAGDTEALPDATSNQWKVTVEDGIITRFEMMAIAD